MTCQLFSFSWGLLFHDDLTDLSDSTRSLSAQARAKSPWLMRILANEVVAKHALVQTSLKLQGYL